MILDSDEWCRHLTFGLCCNKLYLDQISERDDCHRIKGYRSGERDLQSVTNSKEITGVWQVLDVAFLATPVRIHEIVIVDVSR